MNAANEALLSGIYALVDPNACANVDAYVKALLRGGIRLVQLRDKRGPDMQTVARLHALCRAHGATLLINDDWQAALLAGGVHLGQDDFAGKSIAAIRRLTGDRLLGISAGTIGQAQVAFSAGADYLGVGPFKTTASKADAGNAIGSAGLAAVVRATPLPVAAIGGITIEDLPAIVASGARMAAVLSALSMVKNVELTARTFVECWAALTR